MTEQEQEPLIKKARNQTKKWRKEQLWYDNGRRNECENFQIDYLKWLLKWLLYNPKVNIEQPEELTPQQKLKQMLNISFDKKTHLRIHISNNELVYEPNFKQHYDGFEYTEDFDAKIVIKDHTFLFNLKMICDKGGTQTRSLRELYHFIGPQMEYLGTHPEEKTTYFVNILDGDACYEYTFGNKKKNKVSLLYLREKYSHYNDIQSKVYIGDMYHFKSWYQNIVDNI